MNEKQKFLAYARVQLIGSFNMLSSEAIAMTGLSRGDYFFILNNYSELMNKYKDEFDNLEKELSDTID